MERSKKITVSVALITFNGAEYVSEQLQSIFEQTRPPDEIVIYDDGSTDDTLVVIRQVINKLKKSTLVKIFINERRLGYSQNFSRALSVCSGDYVFLSDQDDVWLPKKIEKVLGYFEQNPGLHLLIHDVDYCKEDLKRIGQTKIQRLEGNCNLETSFVVGMATAVRGTFLRICLPVPNIEGVAHDNWLHNCAAIIGCKGIIREVLALYRRHDAAVTSAGRLNVDFVTSARYLKKKLLPYFWGLVAKKSDLGSMEMSQVVKWLEESKEVIIAKGFASRQIIETHVHNELLRVAHVRQRRQIQLQSRIKRVKPVILLYRNGGYNKFFGWKSALKDILLN